MIKVLLFTILAVFCAQTPDTCSKKEGCSFKPVTLESALAAPAAKADTNKAQADKKPAADRDINPPAQPPQNSNNESAKKTLENPQYLLVWIMILAGLYFYLRDKKKKGKK